MYSAFSHKNSNSPTNLFEPSDWHAVGDALAANKKTVWTRVYLGRELEVYAGYPSVSANTIKEGNRVVSTETWYLLPPGMSNELRYVRVNWTEKLGFEKPIFRSVSQESQEASIIMSHFALELCPQRGRVADHGFMLVYAGERTHYFIYSNELGISKVMEN